MHKGSCYLSHHTNVSLKKGLLLKEICSKGEQILPFKIDMFSEGSQKPILAELLSV